MVFFDHVFFTILSGLALMLVLKNMLYFQYTCKAPRHRENEETFIHMSYKT